MTSCRSILGAPDAPISSLAIALAIAAGCNALTGADALEVDPDFEEKRDDDDQSGDGDGSGTSDGSTGLPGSTGGDPGGTGGFPGTGGGSSTGDPPSELAAAQGVSVTEIALYQAVKRTLMKNGSPGSGVPVVAGRDAFIRVFVSTDGSYDGSPVSARLYVGEGSAPLEVTQPVGSSSDNNLGSTINFSVAGAQITTGTGFRFELGKASSGGAGAPYSYPASGFEPLGAQNVGSTLKIVLVPIAYGADGSNRLPDTSPTQLERYKDRFQSMYPVPTVDISVHANVQWNGNVSPNGSGWGSLLDGIASLRQKDGAPFDVYYYGIFEPAPSFGAYCGGGCVAGLGMIGGPSDGYSHAAIGLGYPGEEAADTAVHEIGHTHGRQHAPCQVGDADPQYPYAGGAIGVWGYDAVKNKLLAPNNTADMMGYCKPIWISDYTFNAILQRIAFVNGASLSFPQDELDQTYDRVLVESDGTVSWLDPIGLHLPPQGEKKTVTLDTDVGPAQVDGAFYPFDHLPGGILLVKKPAVGTVRQLSVEVLGRSITVSR